MIFKIKINDNLLHYGLVSILLLMLLLFNATFSFAQIQKGQDINGGEGNPNFGYSVSMSDLNTLAIGSPFTDEAGNKNYVGYVRVYRWKGYWQQKGTDIDGEVTGDFFGYSVSMPDSNTLAIGAILNSGNGRDAGHVRVYSWNDSAWVQKGLDIDGEARYNQFGHSVSMPDSNTLAIGAPYNSGNGIRAGHVRVYSWNGSAWKQKGSDIDGEAEYNLSGWSISMPDSNTIAIGAPANDGNGNSAGHVRIYRWNGKIWQKKGTDIDGEAAEDESGRSVRMPDSNTLAIGNNSHVKIYKWKGNAWQQKGTDIDSVDSNIDYYSVSMPDSNTLAVANQISRVFSWSENDWRQKGSDINTVNACASMPDSNTVAIRQPYWNYDGRVRVYSFCNTTANISPTACDSFVSPSGKRNWKRSGSYKETILNAEGCDSIVSIDLTILNSTSSTDFIAACDSFKWIDNVLYTSSTDTATFTLTNAAGCDSVVTLDLSITSVDTTIIKENDTLIANQSAATYQWLNCDSSFSEVSGANSQSFKPENSGSYTCEITLNGCVDTTSCYQVTIASIEEEPLSFEFKIHPNPVGDFLSIEIGSLVQNASMRIRNINGQLVYENSNLREGNNQVNVSNWAKGVYFVRIIGDDFDKAVKIVKQ